MQTSTLLFFISTILSIISIFLISIAFIPVTEWVGSLGAKGFNLLGNVTSTTDIADLMG